jgi:hydrophobic/amphiphilic exporter-1 (mainly G- bacteria), HAE1 family
LIRAFITFAIERPILNHLLLIFILLLSIFAYINIPKEIFPPVNMDKITITGGYSGTSADVLDKMVVKTIEDDLKNISELQNIETTIKNGSFVIMSDIKSSATNMQVLSDVKDVISEIKRDLPADMSEPVAKIVVNTIPLVLVAISSRSASDKELLKASEDLKSSLSKFKELSDITIRGDADEELVVRFNENKIKAYDLSIDSVVSSLSALSSIFPIGTIKDQGEHLFLSTYNGEKDESVLKNTTLNIGGKTVRLGDIADVKFELSDSSELSHYNGVRNLSININKSEDGNSIDLVKQIRKELKDFEELYPNIGFDIYTDTSVWIKNRLNTVFSNIIFGLALVFLAMLVFVNRGIALVVAMGIPLSFMIGLIVTELLGYSLNMLSLLGALIALGMLVDEAIVVAENIYRHLEEGMERKEAVILGATEMFPAVLTATLTTVFAFLPLLMMSGEMGAFIKILPIMISVLLVSSLFEAFYFLPLHSYDFLKLRKETHSTHEIWAHLYRWYDDFLHFLFKKPKISLLVIVSTILIATVVLVKNSKFQLFPDFDVTQVFVKGKVDINNELSDTEKLVSDIEKKLLLHVDNQEIKSITSVVGMMLDAKNQPKTGEHFFQIFIDLHERAPDNFFNKYINPYLSIEYDESLLTRHRSAKEISEDTKKLIDEFKNKKLDDGSLAYTELGVSVSGTGVVAHDIEIAVGKKENEQLLQAIDILSNALSKIDGVHSIADDATEGEEEVKIRVNEYGQKLGFNESNIASQLRSYYLKGEYSKMFNSEGLVRIKLEGTSKDERNSLETFRLKVPFADSYIALSDIADFIYKKTFVTIQKDDAQRFRSVVASIDNKKITADEAMKLLEPAISKLKQDGFLVKIKGEASENEKTKREMSQAAIMAVFLIFITLVWLFNSIVKPLIVISTIPLVLFGVYFGHLLMGLNLTMPGMIGIVGLAGVVVNDGLIMVEFIKNAKSKEDLMKRAKTRLRPILLTSITTVLGLSTLIFFASGQAQILQPMAVSLGFGITWATFLNLIYVPLLYSIIYKVNR